jgi:coproporphyrinogen III oxidase
VFEKAGVGVSVVHGLIPPSAVAQMNARSFALFLIQRLFHIHLTR